MRLLAHARLALVSPDTTLIPNVGACALRRHQLFFIREATSAQQTREAGRGGDHTILLTKTSREIRHGDVGLSLYDLNQERLVRCQLARAAGPALASRSGGARLP